MIVRVERLPEHAPDGIQRRRLPPLQLILTRELVFGQTDTPVGATNDPLRAKVRILADFQAAMATVVRKA